MLWNDAINHFDKYTEMKKNDFKQYEMERRFLNEQKARHIKREEKRNEFLEQLEKEKAEAEAAKLRMKEPMSKDQLEEVWDKVDQLPKDEWDPRV